MNKSLNVNESSIKKKASKSQSWDTGKILTQISSDVQKNENKYSWPQKNETGHMFYNAL